MDCSFSRVSCEKSREREKELNGTRNCRNRRQKVLANGFRGLTLKLRVTVGQESVRERPKRVRRNKALALRTLSGLIALNLSHSLHDFPFVVPFRFYRTLPLEEGRDQLEDRANWQLTQLPGGHRRSEENGEDSVRCCCCFCSFWQQLSGQQCEPDPVPHLLRHRLLPISLGLLHLTGFCRRICVDNNALQKVLNVPLDRLCQRIPVSPTPHPIPVPV